jgi:hypothetical protein
MTTTLDGLDLEISQKVQEVSQVAPKAKPVMTDLLESLDLNVGMDALLKKWGRKKQEQPAEEVKVPEPEDEDSMQQ